MVKHLPSILPGSSFYLHFTDEERKILGAEMTCLRSGFGTHQPGTALSTLLHCQGPQPVGVVWGRGKMAMQRGHFVWIADRLWVSGSPHSHGWFGARQTFTRAGFARFIPRDSERREERHPPATPPSHPPALPVLPGKGGLQEMVEAGLQARLWSQK